MKMSVFLNADVSNTNADFYVMIENIDICISEVQISAFQWGISIQLHIAAFLLEIFVITMK